jgi:ubiquitin-protein ligase
MDNATKRLLRDFEEIKNFPLETVSAAPLEHDLFTWHANVCGVDGTAYATAMIHLELRFSALYPNEPPSLLVLSPVPLPHPHVHGDKLCLDLLSDFRGFFQRSASRDALHTGWSSAYSVLSILLQLQAFLLELDDDEAPGSDSEGEGEGGGGGGGLERILIAIPAAVRSSRRFGCPKCPHRAPEQVWPPLNVRRELSSSMDEHSDALICFHSKKSWREDCLGLGLRIERNQNSHKITTLSAGLDIVSYSAFTHLGVRAGVLASEAKWTHWIPLWINPEHGTRAFPLLRRVLGFMYCGNTERFEPEWGFELIAKMMNHFIVQVMKGDVFASERALVGYCYFHRWLQVFASSFPDVLAKKVLLVSDFIRLPERRNKSHVPDLGEFLTLISLDMKYGWEDVKHAYLGECYARNALWIVRAHGHLRKTSPDPAIDRTRPELSFSTNRVSLHLCLFHIYFLRNVGRPAGMTGEQVARRYDERLGRPSREMRNAWQASCRQIMLVASWDDFFLAIGEPVLSRDDLNVFLRRVIRDSPYLERKPRRDAPRRDQPRK